MTDEYKNVVEVYPNLRYKPCIYCNEATHYFWNCPTEQAKENAKIKADIERKLNAPSDKNNQTVKRIYQHLVTIKVERSTQEIADRVKVSPNTARKWLNRLYSSGLIDCRQKYYRAGISLLLWKARASDVESA